MVYHEACEAMLNQGNREFPSKCTLSESCKKSYSQTPLYTDTSALRRFRFVPGEREPSHFILIQPVSVLTEFDCI